MPTSRGKKIPTPSYADRCKGDGDYHLGEDDDPRSYRSARVTVGQQKIVAVTQKKATLREAYKTACDNMLRFVIATSGKSTSQLPPVFQESPERWLELNQRQYNDKQDAITDGASRAGVISPTSFSDPSDTRLVEHRTFNEFRDLLNAMWCVYKSFHACGQGQEQDRAR